MTARLRIGLRLAGTGTLDISKPGNVQGDEQVALGWQKYLLKSGRVETVRLYDSRSMARDPLDVLIHFNPFLDIEAGTKNLLYLQNGFPEAQYEGGVAGVFRRVRDRFDGFLFTSRKLMQVCADGAVIPFATDPDMFSPKPDSKYRVPVALVGNDIRGAAVNHRYFIPAMPLGLVVYGNRWFPPLSAVCRGKLPMDDLPKLYSSAAINLNAHLDDHVRWGTVNLRIYDILACGGFVISDFTEAVAESFGDAVVFTEGNEDLWAKVVRYKWDVPERTRRSEIGRRCVMSGHTYEHRVNDLLKYLHEVL